LKEKEYTSSGGVPGKNTTRRAGHGRVNGLSAQKSVHSEAVESVSLEERRKGEIGSQREKKSAYGGLGSYWSRIGRNRDSGLFIVTGRRKSNHSCFIKRASNRGKFTQAK